MNRHFKSVRELHQEHARHKPLALVATRDDRVAPVGALDLTGPLPRDWKVWVQAQWDRGADALAVECRCGGQLPWLRWSNQAGNWVFERFERAEDAAA